MRAFKDENIQNKQEGQQNLFEYVTILADKLQFFLIHNKKSDFSTFKI